MFDIPLRPLKDNLVDPLIPAIPESIQPTHLTFVAFLFGLASCATAAFSASPISSTALWLLNRLFDCLDGSLARHRNLASELGGFLDLLGDFIVYSAIPICCAVGQSHGDETSQLGMSGWAAVAVAESSFHVNNFVLFFVAALVEKHKATVTEAKGRGKKEEKKEREVVELTSLSMRPALVEGFESGMIFTLMLAFPTWTETLCWLLAAGVMIGTTQRVSWTVAALRER